MASFYDPTYDPLKDTGSSGVEVTDLRPEQARDVDLRRLDPEERDIFSDVARDFAYTPGRTGYKPVDNSHQDAQARLSKFMQAAKTAGEYKKRTAIAEPAIRGRTPRGAASIEGVELPSMGDGYGGGGSNYADKPKSFSGRSYSY